MTDHQTAISILNSLAHNLNELAKETKHPSLLPFFQALEAEHQTPATAKLVLLQQQFDAFNARVSNLLNSIESIGRDTETSLN